MRRILLAALCWVALDSSAQVPMSQVLKQMPDSIVPYLSENNKLDMIDFLDSKMKAEVHNLLDGRSELLTLTERSAALQLNEASRLDIRLLDVEEPIDSASQIVCLVSTYGTDVQESRVAFYSLRWHPLPTARFVTLPAEMFTAYFSDDAEHPVLSLRMAHQLDRPANEEQKPIEETTTNLKWSGKTFNKY